MRWSYYLSWFALLGAPWACASAPGSSEPFRIGPLPGLALFPDSLRRQLAQALAAKGPAYRPRTRHLLEDGSPKFTNRLILESSPYLQQHAHNPVNWYPWGEEAFEAARREHKLVLLSVGYSTCHWCHVMEHESFEDEEIARYLNEHYIAIKVDREERPDVDAIYMRAVQALAGQGGWPMTVWLTPEGEPFFGGTYFPARDGDRGAARGFLTYLRMIHERWAEDPSEILQYGARLAAHVRQSSSPAASPAGAPVGPEIVDQVVGFFARRFDPLYGGVQGAPKFPSNLPLRLLLRHHRRTGDPEPLKMVTLTLEKMAAGGIHDQIGGGFHRYSTDARWLVPHFEKMLYDNALLTEAYLEGYQATGREDFAQVARRILAYVAREMTSPEGAFYSATDADSLGPEGHPEEGWFFTWTPAEFEAVLGKERAAVVAARYGLTQQGNFERRNVLHVAKTAEEVAAQFGQEPATVGRWIEEAREALYRARKQRPAPALDDKILTAWNGLMISAFARAAFVLDETEYSRRAAQAARFVLSRLRLEGRLLRSYREGRARHNGYLDDYAFLIRALLDLYETTWEPEWLVEALRLQERLDRHYWDGEGGGYYMTSDDHETLIAREKPAYDGAEPSGNSIALENLLRLHELTTDDRFRQRADALLQAFAGQLRRYPASLTEMLVALEFRLAQPKEIVIVTPGAREQAGAFLDLLRRRWLPQRVLVVAQQGADLERQAKLVPLLQGKVALQGKPTAYVCQAGVCKLPVTEVEAFLRQLEPTGEGRSADRPEQATGR